MKQQTRIYYQLIDPWRDSLVIDPLRLSESRIFLLSGAAFERKRVNGGCEALKCRANCGINVMAQVLMTSLLIRRY